MVGVLVGSRRKQGLHTSTQREDLVEVDASLPVQAQQTYGSAHERELREVVQERGHIQAAAHGRLWAVARTGPCGRGA